MKDKYTAEEALRLVEKELGFIVVPTTTDRILQRIRVLKEKAMGKK